MYAQGTEVDVEKPKQIWNETRTAIEANDDPGALSQLNLADDVLSGDSKISASSNMINTTAWSLTELPFILILEMQIPVI